LQEFLKDKGKSEKKIKVRAVAIQFLAQKPATIRTRSILENLLSPVDVRRRHALLTGMLYAVINIPNIIVDIPKIKLLIFYVHTQPALCFQEPKSEYGKLLQGDWVLDAVRPHLLA